MKTDKRSAPQERVNKENVYDLSEIGKEIRFLENPPFYRHDTYSYPTFEEFLERRNRRTQELDKEAVRQADLQPHSEQFSIPHQGGHLRYYFNRLGEAVLCDYIGNAQVLLLPGKLQTQDSAIIVSNRIPDEAFGSCTDVRYVVCDYGERFDFGYFCFANCTHLNALVTLQFWQNSKPIDVEAFTFTDADYAPKEIPVLSVMLGDRWMHYRDYDHFHPNPETEAYLNQRDRCICDHYKRSLQGTRQFCMGCEASVFERFLQIFAVGQETVTPDVTVVDYFSPFGLQCNQRDRENHPYLQEVYNCWLQYLPDL